MIDLVHRDMDNPRDGNEDLEVSLIHHDMLISYFHVENALTSKRL